MTKEAMAYTTSNSQPLERIDYNKMLEDWHILKYNTLFANELKLNLK